MKSIYREECGMVSGLYNLDCERCDAAGFKKQQDPRAKNEKNIKKYTYCSVA